MGFSTVEKYLEWWNLNIFQINNKNMRMIFHFEPHDSEAYYAKREVKID